MELEFAGEIVEWRGPAPYYFVPLPPDEADLIDEVKADVAYWGVIPVTAFLGDTSFTTSMFPREETYFLPLKDAVRQRRERRARRRGGGPAHRRPRLIDRWLSRRVSAVSKPWWRGTAPWLWIGVDSWPKSTVNPPHCQTPPSSPRSVHVGQRSAAHAVQVASRPADGQVAVELVPARIAGLLRCAEVRAPSSAAKVEPREVADVADETARAGLPSHRACHLRRTRRTSGCIHSSGVAAISRPTGLASPWPAWSSPCPRQVSVVRCSVRPTRGSAACARRATG